MPEDESKAELKIKRLLFITIVLYGLGYLLIIVGPVVLMAEVPAVLSLLLLFPIYITAMIFVVWFVNLIFSVSIIRSGNWLRMGTLADVDLSSATTPLVAFALRFVITGAIIMTIVFLIWEAGLFFLNLFLYSLVFVVGGILLILGFAMYQGARELAGALLLLASVVLVYVVSNVIMYLGVLGVPFDLVMSSLTFVGVPLPGPLMSQYFFEAASLLLVIITAIVYSNPAFKGVGSNKLIAALVSVSAVVFSAGLMYFNFWAAWQSLNILVSGLNQYISTWILTAGFIITGISGVLIIASAAYIIAPYARKPKQ